LIVNDSTGDFYFFAPPAPGAPLANAPVQNQQIPALNEAVREDQFWQDTKAPDNIEGYQAYLGTYPNGRYAGLARATFPASGSAAPLPAIRVDRDRSR